MKAARLLVWLVSLVALTVPPVATGHAMAQSHHAAAIDCPGHVPPPAPCPEHDTAKHAAGTCCSLMTPMVALLPAAPSLEGHIALPIPRPARLPDWAGRTVTRDPPPPRA
ncbi:MAG: hypothetical protein JO339_15420 [Alphaproteobacteria bacterium]|nr:hypothetical protein [Alphaproteobacteria bacterium]